MGNPTDQAGIDPVLFQKLMTGDWRERQQVVEALAQPGRLELARAVLEVVRLEHANLGALSASLKVLEKIGRPLSAEMIQLLEGEDRELRTFVPLVLSEVGGEAAVHALIAALQAPDQPENVKFNAIEALGKLGAVEAVEPLRQVLRSGNLYLTYPAIVALGQIGRPEAVDDLLAFLQDDYLSEPAVTALGGLGAEQTASRIASVIIRWLEERRGSAEIAVASLAAFARRLPDSSALRESFLSSLGPAGLRALLALAPAQDGAGGSQVGVDSPFWADLALIFGWLAESGQPETAALNAGAGNAAAENAGAEKVGAGLAARSALVRLLAYPKSRPAAEQALSAGSLPLVDVVNALYSPVEEVPCSAARLLGASGDSQAAAPLLDFLIQELADGEDDTLLALVVDGLGQLGARDAQETLLECLGHPSAQVRRAAVEALGKIATPGLENQAAKLLERPEPSLREAALRLLARLDEQRGITAVMAALQDPSADVRRAAVELLPQFHDPRTLEALRRALQDPDAGMRRAVVQASSLLPSNIALPLLRSSIQDENVWVRLHALRGLGQQQSFESFQLVLACLEDAMPPVRAEAATIAAAYIKNTSEADRDPVLARLRALLQDEDESVRQAARAALAQ